MDAVGRNVAPRGRTLTLPMGDFNFVEHREDLWSKDSGRWSGHLHAAEGSYFQEAVTGPRKLQEVHEEILTHENTHAKSRLGRAYSNHFLSDQPDRTYSCCAMPAHPLSAHKAITFRRRAPTQKGEGKPPISRRVYGHPDFGRRAISEFFHLQGKDSSETSPFRQLVLMKQATHTVAEGC